MNIGRSFELSGVAFCLAPPDGGLLVFYLNSQLLQQKAMIDAYVSRLESQGEEESVIAMVREQITASEKKQLTNLDNMLYKYVFRKLFFVY